MTSFQVFFAILGAVLYLVGFVPYIYHVFHGRVVPHPFTWTIGCILSSINTYALVLTDGMSVSGLTPVIRSGALLIGAMIGWTLIRKISIGWFDYLCVVLALVCLGLAYRYGAAHAIIPTILVDILVLTPTLTKIWRNPDSEDAWAWILVVFSQAATLLSLSTHTLENSLFWGYVMCMNALVAVYILRRRLVVHSWRFVLTHIRETLRWRR